MVGVDCEGFDLDGNTLCLVQIACDHCVYIFDMLTNYEGWPAVRKVVKEIMRDDHIIKVEPGKMKRRDPGTSQTGRSGACHFV